MTVATDLSSIHAVNGKITDALNNRYHRTAMILVDHQINFPIANAFSAVHGRRTVMDTPVSYTHLTLPTTVSV